MRTLAVPLSRRVSPMVARYMEPSPEVFGYPNPFLAARVRLGAFPHRILDICGIPPRRV